MPGRHGPPEERFWRHVSKTDGCWLWQASMRAGYGQFKVVAGQSPTRAHRFAWTAKNGPIPMGMNVCHACDSPACVKTEPDDSFPAGHLFLGTSRDNTHDMFQKGRAASVTDRLGRAKLTPESVVQIRKRYAGGGVSIRALAAEFGVHHSNIVRAIKSSQWRHIVA